MRDKIESLQLINTAIIKCQEKNIETSYEQRLNDICKSPVIDSLDIAIEHLSKTQKVSREQSAIMIIEMIKELDHIWSDYVMMEGIDRIKNLINNKGRPVN